MNEQTKLQVHQFPCLEDNYGYLVHDPQSGFTACVDTPEVEAIERALAEKGWKLTHILNTHHHTVDLNHITLWMVRINDWYAIPVVPMLLMSSNRGGQVPLQEVTTNTNSTFHLEGRLSRLHPSPTASRVVDALERKGYVTRAPHPGDAQSHPHPSVLATWAVLEALGRKTPNVPMIPQD